jgi:hypothetical protein
MKIQELLTIIDENDIMYVGEHAIDNLKEFFSLKNPVKIAFDYGNDGKNARIMILPVIFDEFLSIEGKKNGIVLNFQKSKIKWFSKTIEFDQEFVNKYNNIFTV